jgi:hypothetical protein
MVLTQHNKQYHNCDDWDDDDSLRNAGLLEPRGAGISLIVT